MDYKIIGADGREYAAASLDELRAWIEEGRVGPATWVWNGSEARWQPAAQWAELQWDFPAPPPVIEEPPPAPRLVDAEFPIRAAAFILDLFIVAAVFRLLTLPWADTYREVYEAWFRALEEASKPVDPKPLDPVLLFRFHALFLGTFLPIRMAYFVGFHGALGATPGKLLFGLRVVRVDDTALSFPRALLRFVAEMVSLGAFGVGYLVAVLHPERRALHDLVANTRVVRRQADAAVIPDKA